MSTVGVLFIHILIGTWYLGNQFLWDYPNRRVKSDHITTGQFISFRNWVNRHVRFSPFAMSRSSQMESEQYGHSRVSA